MQPLSTINLMAIFETLSPLALNILGIAAFGIFIFNFYRFIARKDIFTLNLKKHNKARRPALRKTVATIFYIFKFLMLYPVFVFFWFCVMAAFLYLLGRTQSIESVMLVAMGVVGAIRVCSYYKEALARDISKILPFALLGILIIDNSLVRVVETTEGVLAAALLWETLVYYLVTVVVVEFILRMVTGTYGLITGRGRTVEGDVEPEAGVGPPTPAAAGHIPSYGVATETPRPPAQTTPGFQAGASLSEKPDFSRENRRNRVLVR